MDKSTFEANGYAIIDGAVELGLLEVVRVSTNTINRTRRRGGVRNPLSTVGGARAIAAWDGVIDIAAFVLGNRAKVVRAILFDKTPGANWHLGWHQDVTIAVERRIETPGFGPWSVKAGVVHVRPPAEVLEQMVTLRVHIDDCPLENGPLMVLPGSHRHGYLAGDQKAAMARDLDAVSCVGKAGSVVVLRPLLLHASGRSEGNLHRRVLHLEFAAEELAGGISWVRA